MEGCCSATAVENAGGGIRSAWWFGISELCVDALFCELPLNFKAQYTIYADKDLGLLYDD